MWGARGGNDEKASSSAALMLALDIPSKFNFPLAMNLSKDLPLETEQLSLEYQSFRHIFSPFHLTVLISFENKFVERFLLFA